MADLNEQQQQLQEEGQKPEQVCNFFRKPSKNKNIRKRTHDDDENNQGEEDKETQVVIPKRKTSISDNKLHFSTGSSKQSKNDSDLEVQAKAPTFQFESSKEIQVQNDSRATATLETETDYFRDARAIRERVLKQADEALKGKNKGAGDDKLYKGIHGYTDYKAGFRREQTVASEKAGGSHGPLRASAHIRVSARFDYQPDICKDYKETGYCGYGDSCKFMHDRGDYKSGWQLEKDWDEAEKIRKRNLAMKVLDDEEEGEANQSDDDDDELPFACFICRQPFVEPVMTTCKHYFCEHCALKIEPCPCCGQGLAFEDGTSSAAPVMETGLALEDGISSVAYVMETSSSVLETGLALEDGTSSAAPVMETSSFILETDTYPEVAKPKGKAAAPKKATKKAASKKAPTEAAPKKAPTKCLEMDSMTDQERLVYTNLLRDLSNESLGIVKEDHKQHFWEQLADVYNQRMSQLGIQFTRRNFLDMLAMGQDTQYRYNAQRAALKSGNLREPTCPILEQIFSRCEACDRKIPIFSTTVQNGRVSSYVSRSQANNGRYLRGGSSGGRSERRSGGRITRSRSRFSRDSESEGGSSFHIGQSSGMAQSPEVPPEIVDIIASMLGLPDIDPDVILRAIAASPRWTEGQRSVVFAALRRTDITLPAKAVILQSQSLL